MGKATTRAGTMALFLCLTLAHTSHAGPIVDNFNDNALNSSLWRLFSTGGVSLVSETNQRLELTITGDNDTAGVALRWLALGDFDLQASYALLTDIHGFPAAQDESGPLLGAFGADPNPNYVGQLPVSVLDLPPPGGIYVGAEGDTQLYGYAFTSDQSGRFRLTRVGNVFSAYYWASGDWVLLGSGTTTRTGPAELFLAVAADGDATVSAAFDDFYLQADGLAEIPEPGSFALVGIALGLICVIGKRRR